MAKRSKQRWQSIPAAARRLDRNPGHLRKICAGLEARGLARRVRGGGKKWHWEIDSRATLQPSPDRVIEDATGSTVEIVLTGGITIRITRGGKFEGGIDRASNDI